MEDIDLTQLAEQFMIERGLLPEFSKEVREQLETINHPADFNGNYKNLRHLKWCSIDNDDSKDLDQLTYAEISSQGEKKLFVAIADVASLVELYSPIDQHAERNTTSVYTPTKIFPMLPIKLSTNLTSLNEGEERLAIVVEMTLDQEGNIEGSIYQAVVFNYAQLTYNGVGDWLEGKGEIPEKVKNIENLEEILKLQHSIAQFLRKKRFKEGSLTLESSTGIVKIDENQVNIKLQPHNLAHQLIEEFMIAANNQMGNKFIDIGLPFIRRIVRIPKYWDRIVELASTLGERLPEEADSKALNRFLIKMQNKDPEAFPDLSLTIIKLLGRGEYIVNHKDNPEMHFSLAISNYTHSTAPNRRFPDLIAQRQLKAHLERRDMPYSYEDLDWLAKHCTQQEDNATKVERQINKCAAALVLSDDIGKSFKGIITGVNNDDVWVRIFDPAVEGKIVNPSKRLKVGDRVKVILDNVNVYKGFIDFTLNNNK